MTVFRSVTKSAMSIKARMLKTWLAIQNAFCRVARAASSDTGTARKRACQCVEASVGRWPGAAGGLTDLIAREGAPGRSRVQWA